ncbi:hypothetical protein LOZ58_001209 [Ophidiomyces ophidiicola]|nr:hypothetical protein LOZ58_001209 [Ophidiomyces ophidiicola]
MSSHPTPSAKRRRLDAAQSTLSKPFKSPLRRAVATNEPAATCDTESTCSNEASAALATQGAKKERSSILVCNLSAKTSLLSATVPPKHLKDPQDTIKKASLHGVDISTSSDAQDRIRQLQKQLSSLHCQLSNLRTALDTTTQAVQIEQLKQDPELEALIVKWRLVAREATEELFASARERVNRMGGVGAWKEKIKQSQLRRAEWDACRAEDPPAADGEEEGSNVEREREVRRREIIEVENDNYQEVGVTEDDREEEQDETFTVDMLLSHLNIDLKVGRDMDGAAKQTGFFVLSHVLFGEYAQRASMVARRWYIISDSKTN